MKQLRLSIINLTKPYHSYLILNKRISTIAPVKFRLNGGDSIVISAEGRHRLSQYRSTDSRGRE